MKVLVCGGRDYRDWGHVERVLNDLRAQGMTEICQGGAAGADALAISWAIRKGVPCKTYHANWSRYGKAAGPKRNEQMLREFNPDMIVAFPGGNGTQDMVRRATDAGKHVFRAVRATAKLGPLPGEKA